MKYKLPLRQPRVPRELPIYAIVAVSTVKKEPECRVELSRGLTHVVIDADGNDMTSRVAQYIESAAVLAEAEGAANGVVVGGLAAAYNHSMMQTIKNPDGTFSIVQVDNCESISNQVGPSPNSRPSLFPNSSFDAYPPHSFLYILRST